MSVLIAGTVSAIAWFSTSVLAMLDTTQVVVAVIAGFAGIANTVLIELFRRGQRELREGQETVLREQRDVKAKIGAAQREGDKPPPPPLTST